MTIAMAAICMLLCSAAQMTALAAAEGATWAEKPGFFCHPGVSDSRLHKNTSKDECAAICAGAPHCRSYAVTNAHVPALQWCFAPETDCPNPSGACAEGCTNWDTYLNPDYTPPPVLPFNLSETLTSHMVLQQAPARAALWGWGIPGTKLAIGGKMATATVDASGRWSVSLPPTKASAAPTNLTIAVVGGKPEDKVVLADVMFGEVWLCTGQSNMGVTLAGVGKGPHNPFVGQGGHALVSWSGEISDGQAEIANASAYPLIRAVRHATGAEVILTRPCRFHW
jgi:hypothetical protein